MFKLEMTFNVENDEIATDGFHRGKIDVKLVDGSKSAR